MHDSHDSEDLDLNDPVSVPRAAEVPHPRAVGSPLPVGTSSVRPPQPHLGGVSGQAAPAPPPGRALPSPSSSASDQPSSGLQRAVNAVRLALPFVQRILPILDGHMPSVTPGILTPHPPQHPAPSPAAAPPPPPVNLAPIEDGIVELQTQQKELREQVVEQNTSLRKVEDQLEMVREATDRNTLEQQELMEDLKSVGNKVNVLALVAFSLLTISIILNVILYLHIRRVLP